MGFAALLPLMNLVRAVAVTPKPAEAWHELLTASSLYSVVSSSLLFLLGASMPVASPAEIDLSKLKMIIVFISNVN